MSKLPISPFWSRNPQIPIYLDTGNGREQICPNCDLNSRDHPIHCITTSSPAPPSYRSAASPATSSESLAAPPSYQPNTSTAASSRNLAVPVLRLETPHRWYRPQPPRPALRFDVQSNAQNRPRVRARRVTYTSGSSIPNTPVDDDEHTKKSNMGLGIQEAPFNPDPSPIRSPGSERLATAEKGESIRKSSTPNLAEGLEQKLWKYSASSNVVKRWLLEIISWLLSALCMSAIIITLFFLQGKPLPQHWPMNITLNAYIAVLSRVASASLMLPVSEAVGQLKWSWFQGRSKKMWDFELFDNASRGPWGSLMLLVRTKGMTLAALGAAITIFVMAMDPFFQQVVRYPQRTVLQIQNSSIPRVERYEQNNVKILASGQEVMSPDLDMKAAIDQSFLDFGVPQYQVGNGTQAEIPLSCPTSSCTWEPYETLGVCSQCVDVVDMLDFDCLPAKLDWVQNSTQYVPYKNGTMCGWFFNKTSESPMLMLGYEVDPSTNRPSGEILTTRALPLVGNVNRKPFWGGSINFDSVRNPLINFVVVSTHEEPDQEMIMRSFREQKKPLALECVLSWCVKTIKSTYYEASYTEIVQDRFINTTSGPYPWTTIKPDNPDELGKVRYLQNITVDPHAINGQGNTSSYGLSNQTAVNIVTIFDDYLPSFTTLANNASQPSLKYMFWDEAPWSREFPKNPWSAASNVTSRMDRLATVMTNIMRQASNDIAVGKSFSEESYIEVRWLWLILPVGLLVLTLIFLVGTVIRTSMENDRVGVWKNSAIATLLYGLPDEMQRKITTSQGHGTPRSKAKELNVRMLPTRDWRISGYLLSPVVRKQKPPPGWI
ncbi:hypothetical protein P171DRAFT_379677 [Karstenula rhodostoma CBS 690.94]|uniref:DUF3176 domain containing protein n=1 Tax=Karstenula rhodostoma CBS 690.94 TaxID=1392251 RepID=A0A9P4UF46_9PLEO|nr:hypothetical protein P171DRAFT_379677 [Karstenula rhodostoma CBS 690.94]